jgi:hypothetical protein
VFAKVGAITTIVFGFSFLPHVLLFVGQMLVDRDGALDYFSENLDVLWKVPLSVAVLSLYYGAIGVAVSSLTSRRIVAGVAILGLALVPSAVTGILLENDSDGSGAIGVLNVLALPLYIRDLIFLGEPESGSYLEGVEFGSVLAIGMYLLVLASAFAILLVRYRQPDA